LRGQRRASSRERALREAGAMLVAATDEKEAGAALAHAVRRLMPPGEPYRMQMIGQDIPAEAVVADPGLAHNAVLVPVAGQPAEIAARLAGFGLALRTSVIIPGPTPGGGFRRKLAFVAASAATLEDLRPSFEALMSQGALAIERISLTDEVSRRSSEDYFRTLIQSTSDVILILDAEERIRYASPSAGAVFSRDDLVGTPITDVIAGTDHAVLHDMLAGARVTQAHHARTDLTAVGADRRLLQVECECRDLRDDPTVGGLVLTVRDVTERRQLESDLTHQAFHDGLTGLANRVLFLNRLERASVVAERNGNAIAVLFIDLDDFKEVNDTLGHAVGDQLLIAVGGRITEAAGPLNTAARTGGDEFAVLVEQPGGAAGAENMAARIVAALSVPVEVGDGAGGTHVVNGTVSIGVAVSQDGASTTELQRQADLALYVAKSGGKKNWQRYRQDLHTAMIERLELRSALQDAVAGEQLVLRFQPIVDLRTQGPVGFEALVRWDHPSRGLLPPDQFIQAAEENGAIVEIGAWVLREALRAFVPLRTAVPGVVPVYVSVNVSARQFRTPGFTGQVRAALAETGARPEWLLLEITESLVLRDADRVWEDLAELRDMGVRIAIDDFGTGYSSLSYLRQMPVDVLKIDKSFIDDILHSDQQSALVEAIVGLARNLKLAVVAEGIENPEHRRVLLRMGCPYGQGFLFSRPLPPAGIAHWLSTALLVS
jgi:diguanylate cyclase (GGDEF)-like protein/PAS domain S-box-containing protein